MRCPICEGTAWSNVDRFRLKKAGMCMCDSCGFISYPSKYKTDAEIKDYYRSNYRPAPTSGNLFTGEKKLQYHHQFLTPLFEEWVKAGVTSPVVGEIGAAYGMFLNWMRQAFPKADLSGTELAESYRRVAFHEYNFKLTDELDPTKKYDMIASYHVLEHQLDPDVKLREYASLLKDSGVIYLSCPIWFRDAYNSAVAGFDIEYYWAEDHINCWSEEHLHFLFAKAGLEIIAKDDIIYGNTYILKKSTKTTMKPTFNPKKNLDIVERIFQCWNLIRDNKTSEAISVFPNCPSAWINHYEFNRAHFDKNKASMEEFIKRSIEATPNCGDLYIFCGDILSRYERYDESREMLEKALATKPNNASVLMGIANTWRMKAAKEKDFKKRADYLIKSINILRDTMQLSTEMLPQALSWVYHDESQLPVPKAPVGEPRSHVSTP